MSRAGSSIVINRPIAEVFAYVADQTRTTSWCLGMTECRLTSDTGITVGAARRVEVKVPIMGSASWDFELVECVRNVRMVWNDQDAVIPLRDTYGFEGNAEQAESPGSRSIVSVTRSHQGEAVGGEEKA